MSKVKKKTNKKNTQIIDYSEKYYLRKYEYYKKEKKINRKKEKN
jgi:hypothetical protein